MGLTKAERETIIIYNEAGPNAIVYTHNTKLTRKLIRLAKKYPGMIYPERPEQHGAVSYIVPRKIITIREPYSEIRRKADSERAKAAGRRPPNRKNPIE